MILLWATAIVIAVASLVFTRRASRAIRVAVLACILLVPVAMTIWVIAASRH
jgi:hypothetical protein